MYIWGLQDFIFADRFRDLIDDEVVQTVSVVSTMFPGVSSLWGPTYCTLTDEEREEKRRICYNFLVAWYLVQNYPSRVVGGISGGSTGGMPLVSKSINDISVHYREVVKPGSPLMQLTTNSYGIQALEMLLTAPENFVLF